MSSISDTLGEYMLKGWVLTDRTCSNDGCNVPLMRSPSGRSPVVHFCANCDQKPDVPIINHRPSLQLVPSTDPSTSSTSSDSHISGSSTPPTEVSSALSSPTFALPPESEESRRRREQSDRASAEIGKRLLRGWTMLAEECPNLQCFGIPLVRPPRTSDTVDPNMECVVCETRYITSTDWAGNQNLVPILTERSMGISPAVAVPPSASSGNYNCQVKSLAPPLPVPQRFEPPALSSANTLPSSVLSTLDNAAAALERSLQALSARLNALSDGQSSVDPVAIGLTAESITKATQALTQVKQLHWSERQNLML